MSAQVEILLIASAVSVACVLPGVFLVLRGVALMSDAISHAILLGIVLSFFLVKSLSSIWLIIGAAIAGMLAVLLTELLIQSERIKKDAAIGLVFPVFFSLGVILISQYAGSVHLDLDAVLLGELAFAPFHRFMWNGVDMGPQSLWVMGSILLLNTVFVGLFYKELKLSTFDAALARSLGMSPVLLHYSLMGMTSITAVGAFDAVGSILVVALMITPASSAYLMTDRLSRMLGYSVGFGLLSSLGGYALAHVFDASIAGSMASMSGLIFLFCLFFSPQKGLLAKALLAKRNKLLFASQLLSVQLLAHEGTEKEHEENTVSNMVNHMQWTPRFAKAVAKFSVQSRWVERRGDQLTLTPLGRETARSVMVRG